MIFNTDLLEHRFKCRTWLLGPEPGLVVHGVGLFLGREREGFATVLNVFKARALSKP